MLPVKAAVDEVAKGVGNDVGTIAGAVVVVAVVDAVFAPLAVDGDATVDRIGGREEIGAFCAAEGIIDAWVGLDGTSEFRDRAESVTSNTSSFSRIAATDTLVDDDDDASLVVIDTPSLFSVVGDKFRAGLCNGGNC